MIKKILYIIILFSPALFTGCKKFVDLKPEDSYIDEQVFSNPASIRQAINGLYTGLANQNIYGARLNMEALDLMSGQYDNSSLGQPLYLDIVNNYATQGAPGSTFDVLWSTAYALILKTNIVIGQLEKIRASDIITTAHYNQLLGEVIALRAFIHFDLLRLYGPLYSGNDGEMSIPYYDKADGKLQPILTFKEVMDKILADLDVAEELLIADPVITTGIVTSGEVDFYSGFRNRRMNFYAVKALKARANLYYGKKEAAYAAAKFVVDEAEAIFPWTNFSAIVGSANPDRIFSSEIIFGLHNPDLYSLQTKYFSASLIQGNLLAPTNDQLNTAFEGNENDYRFISSWLPSSYGFRTFFKYADLTDQNKSWRYFQPLIRKSEMYYILAETETDPATAVHYLNEVRFNRGLPDLADDAQLSDWGNEIEKEYVREFYGEGQLFFYYKRINPWWIWPPPSKVPLPVSETQLR